MIRNNRLGYGNDEYCKILIHGEETILPTTPTTFVESSFAGNSHSNHTCSIASNASNPPRLTTTSKFNIYAWEMKCSSSKYSYIQIGSSVTNDWLFTYKPYSFEVWVKGELDATFPPELDATFLPAPDAYVSVCGIYVDANNFNLIILYYEQSTGTHKVKYIITESSSVKVNLSYDVNIFDGEFHHIAVAREDDAYYLYVDGILGGKTSYVTDLATLSSAFSIGNVGRNSADNYINKIILDEFRLSTNICRWKRGTDVGEKVFVLPDRAY